MTTESFQKRRARAWAARSDTRWPKRILAAVAPAILIAAATLPDAVAQPARTFEIRLVATPRDLAMREYITGIGSVEAKLVGNMLSVTGEFEGLKSRATRARIHRGTLVGVRGPAVYELEISSAMAGTIMGEVELSDDALAALEAGHLYIQIDSEGASEGNLWGWLL